MKTDTVRLCRVLMLGAVFAASALRAQTGADALPRDKYLALPKWAPAQQGVGESFRVDLRANLPPVGNQGQGMNSCTGWAVAYALKSYQESLDQGWSPNAAQRVFSPAFVYNQLNGGFNRGCGVYDALELLRTRGCATLASMPYRAGDFKTQPTREAHAEAALFRIAGFSALREGWQVRRALAEGYPVPVVVYTDPVFTSGLFGVFTAAERARGVAARQPNEPHALHAMCVVGYDDSLRAYLLMNSWGAEWGRAGGTCWVHYDLFHTILRDERNMFWEAYVAQDVQQRVGGGPVDPGDRTVAAGAAASYAGYQGNLPAHQWRVWLAASPATLGAVKQVVWTFPDGRGGVHRMVSTEPGNAFLISGVTTGGGTLEVVGNVLFRDGQIREVRQRFDFGAPRRERRLELATVDRYLGRDTNGTPTWQWTAFLRGDLVDLYDVEQVTYHLHPTFLPPNRLVAGAPETGFALTNTGWGTFPLSATVQFKDRSTLRLETPFQFRDPVRDELTLQNTARMSDLVADGRPYYHWTATLDGPLGLLRRIRQVTYHLHPTFTPSERVIAEGAEYGFPLSTSGWGVFTLGATAVFDDGSTVELTHKLSFDAAGFPGAGELPAAIPGGKQGPRPPVPEKGGPPVPEKG